MTTLYFDCFAGASGDMILGALVATGVDPNQLTEQLHRLDVSGYSIGFDTVDKAGVSATYARVVTTASVSHRHLSDVIGIIENSKLSDGVKQRATKVFQRLASAEARVHNQPIEKVHFHEVGGIDAIVDVVGAAIGFELLGVDRFMSSALHVGSGIVEMEHGRFPVPPPAVAELLKGVPMYQSEVKGELVTPTGAAIITTVCDAYGPIPQMTVSASGYGAGTREYEKFPNVLRIFLGEENVASAGVQRLLMIETNVDDMSPQYFGHVMERAFDLGALDCYFTPVQMKKNRPGVLLSVLCEPRDRQRLEEMIFAETTTLGVRRHEVERRALERSVVRVETEYGPIDVKVARLNGHLINGMPEYDQCKKAAREAKVSLRVVEEAARAAFTKMGK